SGLSGLAAITVPQPAPVAPVPAPASQLPQPVLAMAAPVSTPAPTPAPLSSAPASPVPAPPSAPPAPVTGLEGLAYLVGGPRPGSGPSLGARMTVGESAPESPRDPAAAGAAASREQVRASRRLRTVIDRGYRYEFLPADEEAAMSAAGPIT